MRKLATVRTVDSVRPIPDADAIEVAVIGGWEVVTRKGEFAPGDPCVYFEIDSLLPEQDERFAFLMPRGVRTSPEGKRGHVLRTVKLRGQLSQGLAMPLSSFPEVAGLASPDQAGGPADLAQALGVEKWEPPLPVGATEIVGPFPAGVPRTDEERVQNIPPADLVAMLAWPTLVVTEKLDGSSHTVFVRDDGSVGVAGRNWELSPQSDGYLVAASSEAGRWLAEHGSPGSYVQGEVYGEGVQGNPLRVRGRHFAVFAYAEGGRRLAQGRWPDPVAATSVPVLGVQVAADMDVAALLAVADGMRSTISPQRQAEGFVVRGYDVDDVEHSTFKVVNNSYLLRQKG